jgi:fission process protein 1
MKLPGARSKHCPIQVFGLYEVECRALPSVSVLILLDSDVGESFRPIVHPRIVQACYGISWIYILGDVGFETYKAKKAGPTIQEAAHLSEPTRLGLIAAKRGVFQGVASM